MTTLDPPEEEPEDVEAVEEPEEEPHESWATDSDE